MVPWATEFLQELPPLPLPGPGNIPPTISMTSPYADDTVSLLHPPASSSGPTPTILTARSGGGVLFNGETKIGEVAASPYWFDWTNLAAGTYTVSAVATDDLGAMRAAYRSVRFTVRPGSANNNIDNTVFFVTQQYRDFFSREPDPDGLQFWVNNIDNCGLDTDCREVKRIDTSAAFFLSIEFRKRAIGFIVSIRQVRTSSVRGSEALPDTQTVGNGVVVNAAGWQEVLDERRAIVCERLGHSRGICFHI